jgi:hypothetical protein
MRIGIGFRIAMLWSLFLFALAPSPRAAAAAERAQRVPLGGKLAGQVHDKSFAVYVPTRHGGTLTINTSAGTIEQILGPDGRFVTNGQDLAGPNANGWYSFRVSGTAPEQLYTVETSFVQVGQAARMPWNYYYWPTKGDAIHEPWSGGNGRVDTPNPAGDDIMIAAYGSAIAPGQDIILPGPNGLLETRPAPGDTSTWFPNLYDDLTGMGADGGLYQTPAPLLKYDQLFGVSARSWEASYSQTLGVQRWPGHCLGGAVASIMLNEPKPAPGTGMTPDELKSLWAELGENHLNHRIGDNANNIPAGPPRPGWDSCDSYVPRFHAVLERNLRVRKIALLANLRGFPPTGRPDEVWNHGVGKYTARFTAVPGAGERQIHVAVEVVANTGSDLNGQDPKPRTNTYEYTLLYGLNGEVDETGAGHSDWIAVGGDAMYAPLNLMEVTGSQWQGHNPLVVESNVRALDTANGGGARFAGAAPTFKAVAVQEAGRGPSALPSMMYDASSRPVPPPGEAAGASRRGLLRLFGRD